MDREPLVVLLLKIPFKSAVLIKDLTSGLFGKALNVLISVFISVMSLLNFRNSIPLMFLSGILKVFLLVLIGYAALYLGFLAASYMFLSDYPYFSIPLILAEIITFFYILKKSANSVPVVQKNLIKELLWVSIKDFTAFILTLLVIVSIVGISKLKNIPAPDLYLRFIYKALKFAILNILSIPKLIPIIIVPWRLMIFLTTHEGSDITIKRTSKEILEGVMDIIAVACLIGIFLGGFEIKHLYNLYSRKTLTRAKIIGLFGLTIADIFFVLVGVFIVLGVVRLYSFYIGLYDSKGKIKHQKELAKHLLITFWDTLTFPYYFLVLVLLLVPYYRFRLIKTSIKQSLASSEVYKSFQSELLFQIKLEILDLLWLSVLVICMVFPYRTMPRLLSFNRSNWHTETYELLKDNLKDIPTLFLLLIITVTLIRIPLMIRRKNLYGKKHLFYLCRNIVGEVLKDLLLLPYLLVNLLTPWRLYVLYPSLVRSPNPKEQRKVLKSEGLRPIEDYATIVLSIILVCSVWRTVEIVSIVVTHIRLVLNREPVISSLFRKVFRKFLELIIDIFMTAMILCIFIMLIEVPNFTRRIRTFYYLYKDRRGFQYKKYLRSIWPIPQGPEKNNNFINKLNKNVFTNIASFLDVKVLGQTAQVNKKFRELVYFPPIWKNQYERHWKKYVNSSVINEIDLGDDYRELVKKGFENFKRENTGIVLDEEERDYKMGARAIVLEEFVLSIFGFPHIIALPAKAVCYLLSKIDLDWYFLAPRYPSKGFEVRLADTRIDNVHQTSQRELQPDTESLKSFYHIQLHFVYYLVRISIIIFEQIAFIICFFDFFVLKIFSFGPYVPLGTPITQPRQARLSSILYLFQFVVLIGLIVIKISFLLAPVVISYYFTNLSWLGVIFGPFCCYIIWYIALFCNISTLYFYQSHFHNFNPLFVWRTVLSAYNTGVDIGRILFNTIKSTTIYAWNTAKKIIRSLRILLPNGQIYITYKNILLASGKKLKKKGYFGDLIFTPLTLLWIFWPALIPYYLDEYYLFIPIFPIEIFLVIKGYSIAKLAWSN